MMKKELRKVKNKTARIAILRKMVEAKVTILRLNEGWLRTVDIVCEITRTSLWDVYKLPIMVTLNLYCYHIDKANYEKSQIDE